MDDELWVKFPSQSLHRHLICNTICEVCDSMLLVGIICQSDI